VPEVLGVLPKVMPHHLFTTLYLFYSTVFCTMYHYILPASYVNYIIFPHVTLL